MQYTRNFYREADATTQMISFFFVYCLEAIELERKILMISLSFFFIFLKFRIEQ